MRKINFIPVIFATIMAMFLVVSCDKFELAGTENETQGTVDINKQPQEGATNIVLPDDVIKAGQDMATDYFAKLPDEQKISFINAFTITDYLTKSGKIEQVVKEHGAVTTYEGINLSAYLTRDEIQELNSSLVKVKDIQHNSRASWHCYNVYRLVCGIWQYQYTICYWY
jgi:hypothetical protein